MQSLERLQVLSASENSLHKFCLEIEVFNLKQALFFFRDPRARRWRAWYGSKVRYTSEDLE